MSRDRKEHKPPGGDGRCTSDQKCLDRGAPLDEYRVASMRTKGAMKSMEKWLGKPPGNPPISQEKAGFGTYSFL